MPQLNGADGDDLGANDELIAFKDEGEREEKRNVSAEGDLDDVKSSLVNESETNSSSDSEADRRPKPNQDLGSRATHNQLFGEEVLRRRQDGGLFPASPYVGYPFFMFPDLGNLCSPYLPNGALTPRARTYLPFQWPLLDVQGRSTIRDSNTPTHLSNNVPVVQPPHMPHLHPLLSYSPEAFSPQRASPSFSPDAGMSRAAHTACYPASPGGVAQIAHPLSWLQGQSMYPLAGGFASAGLALNASMSSLVSGGLSQRLVPTPTKSSVPPSAILPTGVKQEPGSSGSSSCQPSKSTADAQQEKEEERKPHIKKPLNAFMLYMRDERPKVVAQCKVKESATINQILGQRWHSLSKEEQAKYYEMARKERLVHSKLYPGWSARDNYGKKKKRKRTKSETLHEVPIEDLAPQLKRPRVPGGTADEALPPQLRPQPTQPHTISHLTHSHLSQASPASSLDSPATPTTALASPAAPASTHTELAHAAYGGSHSSPYPEQLQPLSLTTKPHRTSATTTAAAAAATSSSSETPISSPLTTATTAASSSSRCSPPPLPYRPHSSLSKPFLAPPPTSSHQRAPSVP